MQEITKCDTDILDGGCGCKDLLELPCVIGNTVIYMQDGQPAMLACGERKYAEMVVEEMRKEQPEWKERMLKTFMGGR